jgi:hypothetical protein
MRICCQKKRLLVKIRAIKWVPQSSPGIIVRNNIPCENIHAGTSFLTGIFRVT